MQTYKHQSAQTKKIQNNHKKKSVSLFIVSAKRKNKKHPIHVLTDIIKKQIDDHH